jgi:MFS transporter, MHS family, alpha-ketoglutarate permease
VMDEAALEAWGWRIPFLVGASLAVLVFWLRKGLVETDAFEAVTAEERAHPLKTLLEKPKPLLIVLALTAGGSLAFYTFTTYMQKYLVLSAGWTKVDATRVSAMALLGYMMLQPVFGALSDRIGRRPMLIAFGVLGTLLTIPAMTALGQVTDRMTGFILIMAALTVLSCYTSISGLVKAEMFPANVRALGVGLPYGVAVALFGGSAEYVALAFKSAGNESGFFWYVSIMCAVALVAALALPDTKRHSLIEAN